MTIDTIKFSQMTAGGDLANNEQTPGLLIGSNVLFNNPWTFLAPGTTGDRPIPAPTMYYRLRLNTSLNIYEYYDPISMIWTELSGSGTGTVNPGTVNDLAFYAASGQAVSPLTTANNSVLVTSNIGAPSLSTTLPSGLSIPGATITASTAALTAGSVIAAPVAGSDLVNKTYADGLYSASVHSITGTTNQVIVSSPTGNVTLSLPQDIATGSTPTFENLTLNGGFVNDINGNIVAQFVANHATDVNYPGILANQTGDPVGFAALGSDTNIGISITPKGDAGIGFNTSAVSNAPFIIYNGTSSQHQTNFLFSNTANARNVTFPDASGTVAFTSQIPPEKTTYIDTATYDVLTTDDIILVDTVTIAADSSIVLPASPPNDGQVWTIKDFSGDASTYNIIISVSGGGTIDGNTQIGLGSDFEAISVAWSSSQSEYVIVYSFDTLIPLLRIAGNTGAATPTVGVITINGGTTGLTTSASGSTLSLTGILNAANGGTGVNNGTHTLTLAGNLATSGAFASTFTMTGATSVTFPTSGTLATTSQIPTGAALTEVNDTNVTLTLGGSPSTALVNAASITAGWSGQLSLTRGGTNNSLTASAGGIVWSDASKLNILAGTATANQILLSGNAATPAWSTTTYPTTNAINTIMYASSANVLGVITPVNSAVLVSSAGGVPSMSTTLPNINIGTPTAGILTNTTGGGGLRSFQIFTSGTAATYTKPANVTSILVECYGGGGGGGGASSGASLIVVAGGGGGGGYSRKYYSSAASTYTYTVGGAGSAGSSGGGTGGTGGTTSFDVISVTGGAGGSASSTIALSASGSGGGGSGGVGSGGDINLTGNPGLFGFSAIGSTISGAGGFILGGGAKASNVAGAGTSGTNPGSGGSGAISFNSSVAGGAGVAGYIVVWEFS